MPTGERLTVDNAAFLARQWILEELPKLTYPEDQFSGRGIVICGGAGTKYAACTWVCLRALRHVGCTLPIEIWHLGGREYNPAFDSLCQQFGAVHVDASQVKLAYPHAHLAGWELKPYAITWSRFAEVLLLDADNVPVVDPEFLFDTLQYQQAGAIFWPDYAARRYKPSESVWKVFGVPYDGRTEFETGQVLVDKRRGWQALQLANWYSERSPFYFRFVLGDTGIFKHAWGVSETQHYVIPKGIHSLNGCMCQHAPDGRRIFQHRNFRKWQLESDANVRRPGFLMEDECQRWVVELGREWSPAAQTLPAAQDKADVDAAAHEWVYTRVGHDQRRIVLRGDGTFAKNGAACERYWTVRDGRLKIAASDGRLTMDLEPDGAGGWRGKWLIYEGMPATLTPPVDRATRGAR